MNTERIAKGWALIAEGAMELSLAYDALDPAARAAVPDRVPTVPAGSAAGAVPPAPAAPSLTPDRQAAHVAAVLGQCPDHQIAWTVRPAGISKAGKSYQSFWRCDQLTDGTYCAKRPVKAWADRHPIQEAAA